MPSDRMQDQMPQYHGYHSCLHVWDASTLPNLLLGPCELSRLDLHTPTRDLAGLGIDFLPECKGGVSLPCGLQMEGGDLRSLEKVT